MIYLNDIDESYLESNYAPLYHLTTNWILESILEINKLNVGWIENPFFNKKMEIISFTRNQNLNLTYYKDDINVIIKIDKNKLIKRGYKIYPYDFFIQSKKEIYPKANIKREMPFEFEEAVIVDIKNIMDYIISVNFLEDSLYDSYKSVNILKLNSINIYENERRIF